MKESLAKMTGLNFKQVQAWFGNRRAYDRYGPRRKKHQIDGDGGLLRSPTISSSGDGDGSSRPAPPWAPLPTPPLTVPVLPVPQQVLAPPAPEQQQQLLQQPVPSDSPEALPAILGQAGQLSKHYEENVNLIEDEKLELMELAASNRGFPSIYSLDSKTLEQLDLFKDMLSEFPPESVHLKRPFAVQPWIDSEENVMNLLMVWKFLTTFTDLLELRQFTLDELVQSLHDHDSKLLGEIHVSLLKYIIKEIKNVARTHSPSSADVYPRIVKGAFAWEFDMHSWKHHLNFMTWPEILRQFGLSAGLGPKLKKCSANTLYSSNTNVNGGELVENASALTQQRHDVEIDKNDLGELWIAQLTLGEYSDLDAGERLNALVAVIDMSIAGNSLRIILEERLEAANALKNNMWEAVKGTEEVTINKHSQILTQLESAIKREYLSPSYRTTYELLGLLPNFLANGASIPVLDWLADSTAAVALRIQEFDSSITYTVHQKPKSNEEREATRYNGSSFPLASPFPLSLWGC
ncbi:putative homeobox-DDT domain protein RLT1 [Cocos nucifera]|uniref:Putative homeobox-DDT domain protein RLT1 n=1 Tax=Cocos nucifera TaxID=13894 RepID=A0A8K0I492_COCNU|nr:putative homeobox-DDT domain protein RLT1 [Cocos nucifera]